MSNVSNRLRVDIADRMAETGWAYSEEVFDTYGMLKLAAEFGRPIPDRRGIVVQELLVKSASEARSNTLSYIQMSLSGPSRPGIFSCVLLGIKDVLQPYAPSLNLAFSAMDFWILQSGLYGCARPAVQRTTARWCWVAAPKWRATDLTACA